MSQLLFIVGLFVILGLIRVAELAYYESLEREKERVMADYYKVEEARAHHRRLVRIDATVRKTNEELDRIAAQAQGEIIEGTCREVEPR